MFFKKIGKGKQNTNNTNPTQHTFTYEEKSKTTRLEEQIKYLNGYIQELA